MISRNITYALRKAPQAADILKVFTERIPCAIIITSTMVFSVREKFKTPWTAWVALTPYTWIGE